MYKIVASDLDGTLLNTEHTISPFTREVLQRLHQKGEHFVFATGRHHVDVANIRTSIGIPACMITANGARVHDENDNLIYSKNILPSLVFDLLALTKNDSAVTIHIYTSIDWLTNRPSKELAQYHKDSGFHYQLFDPEHPPTAEIAKIFYICDDHEHLVKYEKALQQKFGNSISVAFSTPFCLEVMAEGVSKGAALEAVAKLKGFSLAECIAFGDGMNDVEMLAAAKKGLVMEGALQRVKDTLPELEVIGSNKDEAVAHYLAEHLL